jgi:hypothetical protein
MQVKRDLPTVCKKSFVLYRGRNDSAQPMAPNYFDDFDTTLIETRITPLEPSPNI